MRRTGTVFLLLLILFLPISASADTGPKPSVRIAFTGGEGLTFYGTLLSRYDSTGPASAWNGQEEYASYHPGEEGYEIWRKFVDYKDADGFYFLQEWWNCSENQALNWIYYPPSTFKILLYFPDSDTFCISPVYEKYAFDSYYTADLSQWESGTLSAVRSYDYTGEILALAARIVLTIALELLVAFCFGYRGKRVFALLAVVNVVTQVFLNVFLNVVHYRSGPWDFTFCYVFLELIVFLLEAWIYAERLPRMDGTRRIRAVGYAFVANLLSFVAGLALAFWLPTLF